MTSPVRHRWRSPVHESRKAAGARSVCGLMCQVDPGRRRARPRQVARRRLQWRQGYSGMLETCLWVACYGRCQPGGIGLASFVVRPITTGTGTTIGVNETVRTGEGPLRPAGTADPYGVPKAAE
jgi:hypothetical protein